ncbi:MAG: hypothetical protein AB7S38_42425 [Vulcanimicrobiota bacterium]
MLASLDPMSIGGPPDEYSPEADALMVMLAGLSNWEGLADEVASVFARQFSVPVRPVTCQMVGERARIIWQNSQFSRRPPPAP